MPSAFVVRAAVSDASVDHPTTRLENTPEYYGAVELALARGVLGDIRDPELVGIVARKLTFNQVIRGGDVGDSPESRPSADSGDSRPSHEHLHRVVANGNAMPHGQFRIHTPGTVGAA
jgi:hypothetical protein